MESEWHFIADGTNHVCIMCIYGQQVDRELSPDRFASHRVLRGAHAMTRKVVERSISTTANIYLADGHGQEFDTYRELVMQENEDGTWLVYALRPRTAEVDRLDDGIISGSIKVADEETRAFLSIYSPCLPIPEPSERHGTQPRSLRQRGAAPFAKPCWHGRCQEFGERSRARRANRLSAGRLRQTQNAGGTCYRRRSVTFGCGLYRPRHRKLVGAPCEAPCQRVERTGLPGHLAAHLDAGQCQH